MATARPTATTAAGNRTATARPPMLESGPKRQDDNGRSPVRPGRHLMQAVVFVVALIAGAIASVAGFGIGSLLTPAFNFVVETKVAVAAVSIPHLFGTLLR